MHARMSTFAGPTNQSEEDLAQAKKVAEEQVMPAVRQLDGYRGLIYLADRTSGTSISVTLWDSEEAMRASEAAANKIRAASASSSSEEIRDVQRFEVAYLELGDDVVVR
jgi:heme-degrading monooxygenase HmoA